MAGVQCFGCGSQFGFFKREHDCKNCRMLFCSGCASQSILLPNQGPKKSKVCIQCFRKLQNQPLAPGSSTADGSTPNDLSRNTHTQVPGGQSNTRSIFPKNIPTNAEDRNENVSDNPDDEIRRRLQDLRKDETDTTVTDGKLGEKFEGLTGRKPMCMQNSNITTPTPSKSDVEQTEDLMKQMMAECNIDEGLADSGTTLTDKEIEERLARLKDMDPSKIGKTQMADWDSDEDEETATARYFRQVLDEVALEKRLEDMDSDISNSTSKAKLPGKEIKKNRPSEQPSSIFSREYEVDGDDEELPWCCICNANAVLRCSGCDGDLYCRRCFKEGHSRDDYEDHVASSYRPPRKQ